MNCIYRSIWNNKTRTFVAVSENTKSAGRKTASGTSATGASVRFTLKAMAISLMISLGANVYAQPVGGVVAAGDASISSGAGSTIITQTTQNAVINWQSFSIAAGETVQFVQPNSSSVTLNRVMGSDPSIILGSLSANGKVFLVNPNGILFGKGASVNVGGLVASTLNIADSDFMNGIYKFSGAGNGTVLNQGSINADGGYVALLGANVSNEGVISARLGSVALAAGDAITLDVAGDGLLNVAVDSGAVNALIQNGGLIQADGGRVLLTAKSAGSLLQSAVNNTGVIQAQTIVNRNGTIMLMGDMQNGTVNVGGTLDASAPNGGNGGFIETSAAHVNIADDAQITTVAATGKTGTWLIDPVDFNIAAIGGDITGLALTNLLVNNNVTISTVVTGTNTGTTFFAAPGQGDINVNDVIGVGSGALWTAAGNTTTLTLEAAGDVNVNKSITATNGNLVVCCGRDVNVRDAITTTNGSVSLTAGRDVTLFAGSAMSTTNGNIQLCAGHDVIVNSQITLVNSGSIASQSLGLPLGLTLIAGTNGTGPGAASGSVYLNQALKPVVTRSQAPVTNVTIYYNPTSYTAPTDYSTQFIFTGAIDLTQYMLVYPDGGSKAYDGTTMTTLSGLKGNPAGVSLVANPGSTATFDTLNVGTNKTVTFSGYSLAQGPILTGGTAINYAFATSCCAPVVRKTTAAITAVSVTPPVTTPITTIPGAALSTVPAGMLSFVAADTPTELTSLIPVDETTVVPSSTTDSASEAPAVKKQIVAPVKMTPKRYVAPHRPRKQDRN